LYDDKEILPLKTKNERKKMSFNNQDRVQKIGTGPSLVGIVQYKIEVPPARWDTDGVTKISYAITFPTIKSQSIVDENNLKIAVNPLI
jgi:hypothetical protein